MLPACAVATYRLFRTCRMPHADSDVFQCFLGYRQTVRHMQTVPHGRMSHADRDVFQCVHRLTLFSVGAHTHCLCRVLLAVFALRTHTLSPHCSMLKFTLNAAHDLTVFSSSASFSSYLCLSILRFVTLSFRSAFYFSRLFKMARRLANATAAAEGNQLC